MSKSFFKIFFSKIKENKWLNQLGQSGLLLEKIFDSKYVFQVKENKKYYYSVEFLDCSPESEKGQSIIAKYEERGLIPVVSSGNWIYFVSENEIPVSKIVAKRNAVPYFWRALYLLFFALCGAVVCGYQFFSVYFLDKIEHLSDGKLDHVTFDSSGTSFDKVLLFITKPVNYTINLINKFYLSLITNIFGDNDAVVVIAILLPIVILLTVLGAMNLTEYICYHKIFHKKLRIRN